MATSRKKGKSFMLLITTYFLVSSFTHFGCSVLASNSNPSSNSNTPIETDDNIENPDLKSSNFVDCNIKNPDAVLLKKQQLQLEKLEELVKNLTHLVSRLESQSHDSHVVKTLPLSSIHDNKVKEIEKVNEDEGLNSKEVVLPVVEGSGAGAGVGAGVGVGVGVGSGAAAVLVTKYNTIWSERFQFVSAVKLSSIPTCVSLLPFKDFEGFSKYFAVGDDKGRLYVFLRSGDVSVEFDTFTDSEEASPITSVVSFLLLYKNESLIVTGHENGGIVMHRIWEEFNGDEWSSLHVERVARFEMPEGGSGRIDILEMHHVGRKRYILAVDSSGKIMVFRENGTVYGVATPSRRPVAFLKQRLLFLTETGAGSLDLRTMKLKESECEGLNGSFAKSYVFDAMDRSKAYGFTSEGDLIQTLLLGDVMNFKCRVRSKRNLDLEEPVALQAIKGYLLIGDREKVFVYNVSSQHYVRGGGLRLMFSAGLDEIISSFLNQQVINANDDKKIALPFITSDYEKLVIINLGNGYVAMYRSNLPVIKNEFNSFLWTSPVLFFLLFLFGAWHFFANKKEALTSWGIDDSFNPASVANGAPVGSSAGDRSFTDSSRNSEVMDMRGSGLRGPTRRYPSPPRYQGGAAGSYRPGPDTDPRPGSLDARLRPTSELKFRGSSVEPAGVPKRRDNMFVNGQVVDGSS